MDEEKPESQTIGAQDKGPDFVIKSEPYFNSTSAFSKASVEMRTGASNAEALDKISQEEKRFASSSPDEKKAEITERLAKENRDDAALAFNRRIKEKNLYSETLFLDADGKFSIIERKNDDLPPFAPIILDAHTPDELYDSMKKITEENPELNIVFEPDQNGKFLKYTVTHKTS